MSNRIGRLEFLFWCGAPILVGSIILALAGVKDVRADGSPLHGLFALVVLIATVVILKAEVSRFHDLGWSGWAMLLTFVPLVGILAISFLFLAPGKKAANKYGEPPIFLQRLRKLA
jgi:uncharacterized membrane protein YhaH (DUF805 family)